MSNAQDRAGSFSQESSPSPLIADKHCGDGGHIVLPSIATPGSVTGSVTGSVATASTGSYDNFTPRRTSTAASLHHFSKSGPLEWHCHCCTAKNVPNAKVCRVCGRPENYAKEGYLLPFSGNNANVYRPSQILTVLEDIHYVDEEKWSPLHSACANSNVGVVKQLLTYRAKVEAVTAKGQTPLHLAVHSASVGCVIALLKAGAKVNVKTTHDWMTPLHIACHKEAGQIVSLLVEHGAEIDVRNIMHRTPLHFAAQMGRVDIMKLLLGNGADKDTTDIHGWNARQIAELFGHRDAQELLIREGMTEKQVVLKELPQSHWHSNLWAEVTAMREQRREEAEVKAEQDERDQELMTRMHRQRQAQLLEQRRAERQQELQEYHTRKNQNREIAERYALMSRQAMERVALESAAAEARAKKEKEDMGFYALMAASRAQNQGGRYKAFNSKEATAKAKSIKELIKLMKTP